MKKLTRFEKLAETYFTEDDPYAKTVGAALLAREHRAVVRRVLAEIQQSQCDHRHAGPGQVHGWYAEKRFQAFLEWLKARAR